MSNRTIRSFVSKVARVFFCCALIFTMSSAHADISANLSDGDTLELKGIGMYQELRNNIYIGALFGPQSVTNVEQLKDDNVAKRMSLRFVNSYSNRKLARHWKERMAMNNPRSRWQPMTRDIVGFSRLFKRSFEYGDEINIDHIPGQGTQVYLNGTLFTTIKTQGFVDVLLNVWLGNIPPTKAFKKSIRGQDSDSVKSGYITQYSDIQPVAGRFDADLAPPPTVAKATPPAPKKTQTAPAKKPPVKVAKAQPKPPVKKPPAQKPATNNVAAKNTPTDSTTSPAKPATGNTANNAEKVAVVKKDDIKPNIKLETPKPQAEKPAPKKVAKLSPPPVEEEDFFDVDLIAGSYKRDLINQIRKYQEYPRKAHMKGEEGDVTAQVTIDGQGEIVEIEVIEKSRSRILNRAVPKLIRKAAPFAVIPEELKQDRFTFEVPISFQLEK